MLSKYLPAPNQGQCRGFANKLNQLIPASHTQQFTDTLFFFFFLSPRWHDLVGNELNPQAGRQQRRQVLNKQNKNAGGAAKCIYKEEMTSRADTDIVEGIMPGSQRSEKTQIQNTSETVWETTGVTGIQDRCAQETRGREKRRCRNPSRVNS